VTTFLREAGHFVPPVLRSSSRDAGRQTYGAGGFGEDREGEGIPIRQEIWPWVDVFAVLDAEARAVNDVVALLLAVLFIDDGDQSGAVLWRWKCATTFDELHVHELDDAVVCALDA